MALKKRFSKGMDGKICLHQLNVQLITDDADRSQWNKFLRGQILHLELQHAYCKLVNFLKTGQNGT
jgi:hypothetical protein